MGNNWLDFPLTLRVLVTVLYLPLAVLCPPSWLLSLDWEEAGLDMVEVMCFYLPLFPIGDWEQR